MAIRWGFTFLGCSRHAKHVSEQNAREKVLSSEVKVPVAAVPANTASVTTKKSLSSKGKGLLVNFLS